MSKPLGAHASSVLPPRSSALKRVAPLVAFAFLLCSGGRIVYGQMPPPPLPVDPTPLPALLSDGDKVVLQQARGARREVDAYLAISDTHLDAAEKATENSNFPLAE